MICTSSLPLVLGNENENPAPSLSKGTSVPATATAACGRSDGKPTGENDGDTVSESDDEKLDTDDCLRKLEVEVDDTVDANDDTLEVEEDDKPGDGDLDPVEGDTDPCLGPRLCGFFGVLLGNPACFLGFALNGVVTTLAPLGIGFDPGTTNAGCLPTGGLTVFAYVAASGSLGPMPFQ